MKIPRVLVLLALLAFFTGCAGSSDYTRFHATNLRGETIADWTARGFYYRTTAGYRITAVERVSGPPFRHLSRFPHGWKTTVTGAHIEKWSTSKPVWLYEEQVEELDMAAK